MNPFIPYLPMYSRMFRSSGWCDPLPSRPWWFHTGGVVSRVDGCYRSDDGHGYRYASGGSLPWALRLGRALRGSVNRDAARIDRDYPLPAPPPMSGQVWLFLRELVSLSGETSTWPTENTVRTVTRSKGERTHVTWPEARSDPGLWPPEGGLLFLGPTPWGRDTPWAPPGWKP